MNCVHGTLLEKTCLLCIKELPGGNRRRVLDTPKAVVTEPFCLYRGNLCSRAQEEKLRAAEEERDEAFRIIDDARYETKVHLGKRDQLVSQVRSMREDIDTLEAEAAALRKALRERNYGDSHVL